MVKNHAAPHSVSEWLEKISLQRSADDLAILTHVMALCPDAEKNIIDKQLAVADILFSLGLDTETLAAGLAYPLIQNNLIDIDLFAEIANGACLKLLQDVLQIQSLNQFKQSTTHNANQIENLRKMLLAMVTDVRAVFVILAEHLFTLREIRDASPEIQIKIATDTRDIYSPLANRLGVWQLKWEMEDYSLRYLNHDVYMDIAKSISAKRGEREDYILATKNSMQKILIDAGISDFEISARVKHIYSIYLKMQKKHVNLDEIYDMSALRVLVPTIEDCYRVLSVLQSEWEQISKEFDDYIAQPKKNGYRSIHTVLIGPQNRIIEVQIRTFDMHQESELGVAAHWRYKEGVLQTSSYEAKIALLRQVLEWQKEISGHDNELKQNQAQDLFKDRIYVFTPNGDIVDLPTGSTPLDFAYHIHSEIGHRCRGAKINGAIVQLTYRLKTGERVEILTTKHPQPSRDWANAEEGYLHTARARAKVLHWFRLKDGVQNSGLGREMLEKELKKLDITTKYDIHAICEKLTYKTPDSLFAAVASGDVKVIQLINLISPHRSSTSSVPPEIKINKISPSPSTSSEIQVEGVSNLLTNISRCCKPLPGDEIMGYVTRVRGVSIHRSDCENLLNLDEKNQGRLIGVSWGHQQTDFYAADLLIHAIERAGLIRDITNLLVGEKIRLLGLQTDTEQLEKEVTIYLTIGIQDKTQLMRTINSLKQITNVLEIVRR